MKNDLIIILGLLILLLIFFWKAAALQGMFFCNSGRGDITDFFYPMRAFAAESVNEGKIPLWSSYIYCGFPVFAEGQVGTFYPFNIVLNWLLPVYASFNYCIILTFFMAGIFTYFFARSLALERVPSLISAIIFMFCGTFISHLQHSNMIASASLLPLQFYLAEMIIQKRKIIYAYLLGIVTALQIFAGHPQITLISIFGVFVYCILRLFPSRNVYKINQIGLLIAFLGLAIAIGAGLGAIQLLPTYELAGFSNRSFGMTYHDMTECSYHPKELITLILPYYYGDPGNASYQKIGVNFWEKCAYAGIIPLLLFIISIFKLKNDKYFLIFSGLMILFLLLAMGEFTPLFPFIINFPGFKYFRVPGRFLFIFDFSLAVLAGIAADFWFYKLNFKKNSSLVLFNILQGVLIFAIIIDLFIFGINYMGIVPMEKWSKKPETVKFLEKDKDIFRFHSIGYIQSGEIVYKYLAGGWRGNLTPFINHREVLRPNSGILHHISDANGYSPLVLKRTDQLFETVADNLHLCEIYPERDITYNSNWLKVLGMLNVKYLISIFNLPPYDLKLRMQTNIDWPLKQVKVYHNKYFMPRAFIVPSARFMQGEPAILNYIFGPNFKPEKEAVIEKNLKWGSAEIQNSKVKIQKYLSSEVCIDAYLSDKGFLVLSDTYYPGWKVYVDGKEEQILQANYIVRAVPLDKGRHSVRFSYDPFSFKLGAAISLVTLVGLIFALTLLPSPCLSSEVLRSFSEVGRRRKGEGHNHYETIN